MSLSNYDSDESPAKLIAGVCRSMYVTHKHLSRLLGVVSDCSRGHWCRLRSNCLRLGVRLASLVGGRERLWLDIALLRLWLDKDLLRLGRHCVSQIRYEILSDS